MFNRYIRCVAIVLAVLLAVVVLPTQASGLNGEAQSLAESVSYTPIAEQGDNYIEICRNSYYSLLLNPQSNIFCIADANTNEHLWFSGMTEENYGSMEDVSNLWKSYMQSALAVNYIARDATRANNMKSYSAETLNSIKAFSFENGIRFEVDFKVIDVTMALEIKLDGERIVASVPAKDIKENGDFVIKSVDVLPFFSAVTKASNADGYIVYPDGNGAISYFDRTDDKHAYTQAIALDIYDTLDLEAILEDDKSATAMLPIYGIKNNDLGIMAAITKGSESARINVNTAVSNSEIPIHRAGFEMVYRNEYKIFLSSITGTVSGDETFGVKVDEKLLPLDREVTYFLLRDEKANYSGMANAYRDYLVSNKLINENNSVNTMGLYLNMFMGVEEKNALINPFVEMTSFEFVESISQDLLNDGVQNLQVRLRGWNKGGYGSSNKSFKPASQLGGNAGLKKLSALAETDSRFNVLLEIELLESVKNRYVAVKESTMPITNEDENAYLLSPIVSKNKLNSAINKLKKYGSLEIALASVGSQIYPDYSKSRAVTRTDTMVLWQEMSQNKKVTATQGGNLYMLSSVNQVYDIPMTCSMQQMTDESIPWYSMIISGVMPHTTMAGNQSGDIELLCLQWIEHGAMPYFELTENSPKKLIDTSYNKLFSSQFSKWDEQALSIYKDMSTRLKDITGQSIIMHERDGDTVVLTYGNGYKVLINYGNTDIQILGKTVPARDYVVLAA